MLGRYCSDGEFRARDSYPTGRSTTASVPPPGRGAIRSRPPNSLTTSLGLQIVRTLVVSELGGRLRIAPRPGGGTEAFVDLPVGYESRTLDSPPGQ